MSVQDPSTAEWLAAGAAAGLVVVVASLLALHPVLARSRATPWGRAAGLLLATIATGLVLVVVVALVAGTRAGEAPESALAGVLVQPDGERIGRYAAAILLPLAAVLAVLAFAVVDVGRPSGFRIAAGVAAGVVLAFGLLVGFGDGGTVPTALGRVTAALAAGAAASLALDELLGSRPRR